MTISEFIKDRRESLNISQSDLATRLTLLGVTVTKAAVGHWESGRNEPPIGDARFRHSLAAALEVDLNSMMTKLGYVLPDESRSPEARRAADIVDRMPADKRQLALRLLDVLDHELA